VRPRIENLVRAQGMSLDNVIEINSVAILKSAILADIGATILPVAPLLADIERGEMVAHPHRRKPSRAPWSYAPRATSP
jgi:LysR family nitrogen assimilation transcriptional regulator